jgi:hypothetical protein
MEKSLKNVRNVENFIIFASKYTLGKLTRVYFKRPFKNTKTDKGLNKSRLEKCGHNASRRDCSQHLW